MLLVDVLEVFNGQDLEVAVYLAVGAVNNVDKVCYVSSLDLGKG